MAQPPALLLAGLEVGVSLSPHLREMSLQARRINVAKAVLQVMLGKSAFRRRAAGPYPSHAFCWRRR